MTQLQKPGLSKTLILQCVVGCIMGGIHSARAAYHDVILADNPVAYYRLEELPGATIAVDSSPNQFHAAYLLNTAGNSPQLGLPGIDTNSLSFSGGTVFGHVSIPFHPELSPVKEDGIHGAAFSVEVWAQPNAHEPASGLYSSVLGMFGQYGSGTFANASGWNIAKTPGPNSVWLFNMKNGPFFQTPAAINLLQWYHLAASFDGTNLTFYINGVSQGSQPAPNYLADNGANGQIGVTQNAGIPPYGPFRGGVDEVAFYTNMLSAAQILNHYQVGTNSFRAVPTPPSFISDPSSTTNFSGTMVTFSVVATGTTPLYYQWLRNSSPISNATNQTYTFTAAYPADNQVTFRAVVTNVVGAATSAPATLTVTTNLNINANPFSIIRNVGSYAAFRVVADGAMPITYQWYKGLTLIPGQTNDTLWLSNVQSVDDNSTYFVRVSNPFASTDTPPATLNIQNRVVNVPITGYAKVVMADGPVAYWRLDESTGSPTAVDAAGTFDGTYNVRAGTFTAGATPGIPGETNTALGLTGGAIVTIPYALELNPVTGPWTAEAWVKPGSLDPNNFRTVFSSMWNSDFGNHVFGWNVYQHVAGVWTLNIFNGGGSSTFVSDFAHNPLVPNSWYHMVITDDLDRIRFYVNGILVGSASRAGVGFKANGINGDPALAGGPTVLGQRSDDAFAAFDGAIDDVAFYNKALSAEQIRIHYLNTVKLNIGKLGNNVILTWPFGILQESTNVLGAYTNLLGTSSPFTNAPTGSQKFYRVKVQ